MGKKIYILECRPVCVCQFMIILAFWPQKEFFAERKRLQYFVEASGNDKIDGPFELLSFIHTLGIPSLILWSCCAYSLPEL